VGERSSATQGGLRVGDRILSVNGADVDTLDAYRARLQEVYLRNPLKLRVDREGEPVLLTLPAAQMPSS
jgi:S1-C subfamily serine protease